MIFRITASAILTAMMSLGVAHELPPNSMISVDHYKVWFKVFVSADGKPRSVELLRVEPHTDSDSEIADAAKMAVLTWEFTPVIKGGQPVDGYLTFPVEIN